MSEACRKYGFTFAFTKDMKSLYAADAGLQQADQYAYPLGGSPISAIDVPSGAPSGIAIIPTEQY